MGGGATSPPAYARTEEFPPPLPQCVLRVLEATNLCYMATSEGECRWCVALVLQLAGLAAYRTPRRRWLRCGVWLAGLHVPAAARPEQRLGAQRRTGSGAPRCLYEFQAAVARRHSLPHRCKPQCRRASPSTITHCGPCTLHRLQTTAHTSRS
jgi:hypothetical protein